MVKIITFWSDKNKLDSCDLSSKIKFIPWENNIKPESNYD